MKVSRFFLCSGVCASVAQAHRKPQGAQVLCPEELLTGVLPARVGHGCCLLNRTRSWSRKPTRPLPGAAPTPQQPYQCRNHPPAPPLYLRLQQHRPVSVLWFSFVTECLPQVWCPFCEHTSPALALSVAPVLGTVRRGRLAVVPIEEEQGEGAHHQEEEHPHPEAGVVLDGLGEEGRGWSERPKCVSSCSPAGL